MVTRTGSDPHLPSGQPFAQGARSPTPPPPPPLGTGRAGKHGTYPDPYIRPLGGHPNPLSGRLLEFLWIATDSLKKVINHSPVSFATSLIGYYMVPGKVLAYAGMTASQLGTLALIASVVFKAIEPVVQASTYTFFAPSMYPSDDALRDSYQWRYAVHVINTAVVTACIATAFGVALPTAKGMILTAGLFTGVRYAMVYMQSQGSHHHATYSRQHD